MGFNSYEHLSLTDPKFSTDAQQSLVHQKRLLWQSIDNVDMYKYANFYQNITCGSRVISVFAYDDGQTDRQTNGHTQ